MMPFYFGVAERRLFGVYEAPCNVPIRRAVVVCYPIGREYYLAHRACCALARQIAKSGMDVLRFDYSGTGDSDGDEYDFSARDWVDNVGQAVDELKDLTALSKVSLVGYRFGSVLAARVAEQRDDVDCVVLWDPVLNPDECIGDPARDLCTPELLEGLRKLGEQGLGVEPARRLLVNTEPNEASDELRSGRNNLDRVSSRQIIEPRVSQEDIDLLSAGLPVHSIRVIVEWLKVT